MGFLVRYGFHGGERYSLDGCWLAGVGGACLDGGGYGFPHFPVGGYAASGVEEAFAGTTELGRSHETLVRGSRAVL